MGWAGGYQVRIQDRNSRWTSVGRFATICPSMHSDADIPGVGKERTDTAAVLLLASGSPRRRKILEEAGVRFDVRVPQVAELADGRDPAALVLANARAKNAWCRARCPDRWILSADTLVVLDGRSLGKPASPAEAAACLRDLSGRAHEVLTATVFADPGRECNADTRVTVSTVTFKPLSDGDIAAYLERVDPLDKAGAYDIDQHGDSIVASYTGSRTNIMGLPREVVDAWLARRPEFRAA